MPINFPSAIANDYLVHVNDGTAATVMLLQDGAETSVAGAKRTKLSREQLRMIEGLGIEGQTRSFRLPVATLGGVTPRQGSRITHGSDAWTIIIADLVTNDNAWLCACQKQK